MIQLDVDFSLLNRYFGISSSKISEYANKDLEEIMALEAEQGNTKARDYEYILSNPNKIQEIFKLSNVQNKYIILQNMSEQDLDDLVPYLTPEQLALGLQFFNDDKIMDMCLELPTEEVVGMVFQQFSLMEVMEYMDTTSLDNFLQEPDINRNYAQNYLASLDTSMLQQIMIESFGIDMKDKSRDEYFDKITSMSDQDFNNFLLSFDREKKMALINGIVEQDEKLLLLFENKDLLTPMMMLEKEDKISMMSGLDPEFLVPMIQELPVDLTQVVLTQIDTEEFSKILAKDFQNILSQVVLFSAGSM